MKCRNCGSNLPEDSFYCLACGGKVGDEENNVVSYVDLPFGTVLTCPKCGGKNSRTDRWCGYCDADLDYEKKQLATPTPSGPGCPVCGVSNPVGSQYCRKCGTSLTTDSTHQHEIIRERQVVMIRCKYCGTLNGPTAQKCSSCGALM